MPLSSRHDLDQQFRASRRQYPTVRSPVPQPTTETAPGALTSREDYAVLGTVFLAGLAGVIALDRRRGRAGASAIAPGEMPALALATFALADTVTKEKVSTWLRHPFVEEDAEHRPLAPKGRGMQRAVGELLTCTRCVGTWSALALVGLRTASPAAGRTTANVLALAGANDLMQGGFRLLVGRANQASPRDSGSSSRSSAERRRSSG
jgi:hypothetical protein